MPVKVAITAGCIAPYTHRLYDAYARKHGAEVTVFQCTELEPSRHWTLPEARTYKLVTLAGYRHHKSDISHVYFNPGILPALMRMRPDAVVMGSFSPTMMMAGFYANAVGSALGLYVEGARDLDPGETSWPHAAARKFFGNRATFGMCSSQGAVEMMESWGLKKGCGIMVPHCGSWSAPDDLPPIAQRPYDLLLCGTLNERKNPMFFADVVARMVARGFKPSIRIVGNGDLKQTLEARFDELGVQARFDGYLQQDDIISAYASSKLLLFPTRADTWGLVANEALACKTPVLASPHAISSRELVATYGTGEVRPLDAELWAETAIDMLSSSERLEACSKQRAEALSYFSLETAVAGLHRAIEIGRAHSRRGGGLGRSSGKLQVADRS